MLTEEHKKKISEGVKKNLPRTAFKKGFIPFHKGKKSPKVTGIYNSKWKGDNVGYFGLHSWLSRVYEKPTFCEECTKIRDNKTRFNWANISGKYKRERSDWKYVCVPCHREIDGFTKKVDQYDLQGNYIKTYKSLSSVIQDKFDKGNVSKCCKGKIKSSLGYVWKWNT